MREEEEVQLFLRPGEVHIGFKPAAVTTVLGSCLAVIVYSPRLKAGAICHAMLPEMSRGEVSKPGFEKAHLDGKKESRYVDGALRFMISRLKAAGADEGELEIKLFGAAWLVDPRCKIRIGNQNILMAYQMINDMGLRLTHSDTGGSSGRKIIFHTATGEVESMLLPVRKKTLAQNESQLEAPIEGELEPVKI